MEDIDYLPATQMLESTQVLGRDEEDAGSGSVHFGFVDVGGTKHALVEGENRIGRDPVCQICINNPSLSRIHAVIEADQDGVTVHDNKSSNGSKKKGMVLKPHVRYNLEHGDTLKLGDIVVTFDNAKDENNEEEDAESTGSGTLLDDFDDENIPPNFVPDTPVAAHNNHPVSKGRPSLTDLSFIPESQSSPLPTSVAALKNPFKIPDSPSSDLNDSSFIASSQQPVQNSRVTALSRRQFTSVPTKIDESDDEEEDVTKEIPETQAVDETVENTAETSDILEAETEQMLPGLGGNTPAAAASVNRIEKTDNTDILEANTADLSNLDMSSECFGITQPPSATYDSLSLPTSSGKDAIIRAKMSDSEILVSSTQTLLARLSDSELIGGETQQLQLAPAPKLMTDSLILAAATQVNLATAGEEEEDLLLAATQPVFKMPGKPSACSVTSLSSTPSEEILGAETAQLEEGTEEPILDTETAQLDRDVVDPILDADTAKMCIDEGDPTFDAETVKMVQCDEGTILGAETTKMGLNLSTEDTLINEDVENDTYEQTQCDMSFDDIKDNIQNAEEFLVQTTKAINSDENLFPTHDDDNLSTCSEDLLADDDVGDSSDNVPAPARVDTHKLDTLFSSVKNLEDTSNDQLGVTTIEAVSMIEATQPSTPPPDQLGLTSMEAVSMVEATQPSTPGDLPARDHLGVTSVEDVSMIEATQPSPQPIPIRDGSSCARDKTNLNSVTMDQTVASSTSQTAADKSEAAASTPLEDVSTEVSASPVDVARAASPSPPVEGIPASPHTPTPVTGDKSKAERSLCLQLDVTESPVFKRNTSASQSVVESTSLHEDDDNGTGPSNTSSVSAFDKSSIKAIRRSGSVSLIQDPDQSSESVPAFTTRKPPSRPAAPEEEDSGPLLPSTSDLLPDGNGYSSSDEEKEDNFGDFDHLQEEEDFSEFEKSVDADVIGRTESSNNSNQNEDVRERSPIVPEQTTLKAKEVSSSNELLEANKEQQSNEEREMGEVKNKRRSRFRLQSLKKKDASENNAPANPPKILIDEDNTERNECVEDEMKRPTKRKSILQKSSANDPSKSRRASSVAFKADEASCVNEDVAEEKDTAMKSRRGKKKMNVPAAILDSPATISSQWLPSPVASSEVPAPAAVTKASRKQRAKKAVSEEWIVDTKTKKKPPTSGAIKSKKESLAPCPAPASPGANIHVTAAEVINARRAAAKTETNSSSEAGSSVSITAAEAVKANVDLKQPLKRRGRSKETVDTNKKTSEENPRNEKAEENKVETFAAVEVPAVKKGRGRPKKADNKKKVEEEKDLKEDVDKTNLDKVENAIEIEGDKDSIKIARARRKSDENTFSDEPVIKRGRGRSKKSCGPDPPVSIEKQNSAEKNKPQSTSRSRGKNSAKSEVSVSEELANVPENIPSTSVQKVRGRPKKTANPFKTSEESVIEKEATVDTKKTDAVSLVEIKSSGRGNKARLSVAAKVSGEVSARNSRRRKTEPVDSVAKSVESIEQVVPRQRGRRSSISREDSASSVQTLPAIGEEPVPKLNRRMKRKAESTPERGGSKKRAVESADSVSSSGSGSGSGSVRSRRGADTSNDDGSCSSPSLRKVKFKRHIFTLNKCTIFGRLRL